MRASGFRLKCFCKHHFSMREQIECFGLPFKMSLRATILLVRGYSKFQKDMGNFILAGVRNLSISHSRNDQKCIFGASFGQVPFQAHGGLIFEEWEASGKPFHLECPCERHFLVWQPVEPFHSECPCNRHFLAWQQIELFHLEYPCERHFPRREQFEGFRLPPKMLLRASFSHAQAN